MQKKNTHTKTSPFQFLAKAQLEKNPPKKSRNFQPVPAASTASPCPTIIGLLLWFYNNVQMEWQLCRP